MKINKLRDDYILPGYTAISIFVNKAGNLTELTRLQRVHSLIGDFEKEPQCLGSEFTHFWLRDYEKYMVCFLTLILKKLKSCHYTELEQALFPDVFLISVVAEHRSFSPLI